MLLLPYLTLTCGLEWHSGRFELTSTEIIDQQGKRSLFRAASVFHVEVQLAGDSSVLAYTLTSYI